VLHQTKGIVLKITRFKESSAIVNIYTEKLGLQTYIVNSIFSKKAKNKAAYLQPLSLLNLVVYFRENQNIKRIKEMQWAFIYRQIPFHPVKRAIALFINEVLNKTIQEEEANPSKFNFLYDVFIELDSTEERLSNYLIVFLLELSKQLGIAPLNNWSVSQTYFSLRQGQFLEGHILNTHQLNKADSALLHQFLILNIDERLQLSLSKIERKDLLNTLIRYYKTQIENFGQLKSLPILEKIF